MIGVKRMLDSRPMSIKSRHVHVRDCILTLTLIQTGLRASTMLFAFEDHIAEASITPSEGDIRPKIIRRINNAGDLEWHISVPAIAFKNYKSEYFSGGRPYEHTLSNEDGLYDLLDKYISQSRPYLLYGRDTDAFFVTSHDTDFDGVALNFVYRRITRYYFVKDDRENLEGIDNLMSHGPHAVRHIIATHIMKTTGNLHLAAWAIQDSVRTIERHYARFFPRDKVRLAAEALALARAAGRARMLDARLQKAA